MASPIPWKQVLANPIRMTGLELPNLPIRSDLRPQPGQRALPRRGFRQGRFELPPLGREGRRRGLARWLGGTVKNNEENVKTWKFSG